MKLIPGIVVRHVKNNNKYENTKKCFEVHILKNILYLNN